MFTIHHFSKCNMVIKFRNCIYLEYKVLADDNIGMLRYHTNALKCATCEKFCTEFVRYRLNGNISSYDLICLTCYNYYKARYLEYIAIYDNLLQLCRETRWCAKEKHVQQHINKHWKVGWELTRILNLISKLDIIEDVIQYIIGTYKLLFCRWIHSNNRGMLHPVPWTSKRMYNSYGNLVPYLETSQVYDLWS